MDEIELTILLYFGIAIICFAAYVVHQLQFKKDIKEKKMRELKLLTGKSSHKPKPRTLSSGIIDEEQGHPIAAMPPKRFQATADFDPQQPLVSNFKAGDVIELIDETEHYILGILKGKKEIVPRSSFKAITEDTVDPDILHVVFNE